MLNHLDQSVLLLSQKRCQYLTDSFPKSAKDPRQVSFQLSDKPNGISIGIYICCFFLNASSCDAESWVSMIQKPQVKTWHL